MPAAVAGRSFRTGTVSLLGFFAWERDGGTGKTYLRGGSDGEGREEWFWFGLTGTP